MYKILWVIAISLLLTTVFFIIGEINFLLTYRHITLKEYIEYKSTSVMMVSYIQYIILYPLSAYAIFKHLSKSSSSRSW